MKNTFFAFTIFAVIGVPIVSAQSQTTAKIPAPRLVKDTFNPITDEWQLPARGEAVVAFNNTYGENTQQRFLLTLRRDVTARRLEGLNFWGHANRLLRVKYASTGSKVLVNIGEGLENGGFQPHVWDTETDQLTPLAGVGLAYEKIEGSAALDYVAFVENVDRYGYPTEKATASLYVFDVKAQKKRLVTSNNGVINGFCWQGNTLFYSAFPPRNKDETDNNGEKFARTSIYSLSFDEPNSQPRFIAKDAYRPRPSPDGKRIAFFGPENKETMAALRPTWMRNPHGDALSVMNADGTGCKALNREHGTYPQVRWLDNENLVTLKTTAVSPKGAALLRQVNVESGMWKEIAELSAQDFEAISYDSELFPQFELMDVFGEREIIYQVREFQGTKKYPTLSLLVGTTKIKSVDVKTGKEQEIMKIPSGLSSDWRPD